MNSVSKLGLPELEGEIEALIKNLGQTTHTIGRILLNIRDDKLYVKNYTTWENYIKKRWGWSRRRGYQMIQAAIVLDALPMCTVVHNERQARELAKIPPEQRPAVIKAIVKADGKLTSPAIKKMAAAIDDDSPPPDEPILDRLDRIGQLIPAKLVPLWDRAERDSLEMINWSAKLKARFKKGMDENDIIFVEHSANECFARMKEIRWGCKDMRPYAICYTCQGRTPDKCTTCKGRGFLSFFKWGRQSDEAKEIIMKSVASRK